MWLPAWVLFMAVAVGSISTPEKSNQTRSKRDTGEKRVVCYYTNWSVYRPGTAKFNPQNINPYLCTHLVYAFGGLSKDNSLKPFDKYQDIEQGGYAKFNGLKTYNKDLKTMVAIGGWNEGSARFSSLVADEDRRKEMVRNVIKFLRQNHFDGLDLDWEYPAFRDGGKPRDRDNYAKFVQELREEFERETEKTGRPRLLLTMAVPAGLEYVDKGYDIPKLNEFLDWFNILSYDYHSAFEPSVDHHAPLLPLEPDGEYNFGSQLNIDATVKHYLEAGADRKKLVLGIPTYGRSYTLFNPDATDIGSPADGPGEQGDATREKGYLAYYEICEKVKNEGWTVVNDNPEAMGPYAYKGNQWVGYDDEDIVKAKSRYVNEHDLGGIMFWSIDNDDFRGKCHGKAYPLIEAAKEALLATSNEVSQTERETDRQSSSGKKSSDSKPKNRKNRPKTKTTTESSRTTKTTPAYSTTTPAPPTTPDPGSDFTCKDEGFFPHPRDCKKYFWCLDSGPSSLGIVAHQFTCPSGLVFNKHTDSCDYPRNVICKIKAETVTTTSTTASPASSTTSRTTTSRSKVITASPPRHKATSTTTTTTEEPDDSEEYEDEDGEEEDPNVIKELVGLIKRLGGVEQLEKQLKAQEGSKTNIKTSLFTKVLSGRSGNKFRGSQEESTHTTARYQSVFRSRGPQNSGLENEKESAGSKPLDKPQYVTIQRNRVPSRRPAQDEVEEEDSNDTEEEAEKPKNFRSRPTGNKEYASPNRNPSRNNEETTTTKYKSILRTRSTTEIPADDESEEEKDDEETKGEVDKPANRKYSAVYRERNRPRFEEEELETEERSKVRPQYTILARGKPSTSEESTSPGSVNNVNKYVEIRRGRPEATPENVHIVNSVREDITEPPLTPAVSSTTSQYATIRRKPVTESSSTEVYPVTTAATSEVVLPSTSEISTFSSTEDISNLVERRNDVPENKRRSRPPVLTTQAFVESTSPSASASSAQNTPVFKRSTTPSVALSTQPPKRFQFGPRTRPTLSPPTPTSDKFMIIIPETTLPDWATTPEIDIDTATEEIKTEKSSLPTTAFQRIRSTTPQPVFTTSTETRVVTSITESAFTEREKIMVTKKSIYPKKVTKSTTEKIVSSTSRPFVRSTRPYNPRRERLTTTTTTTETTFTRPKSRFRLRSTTTSAPAEATSRTSRRFTPKRKINEFSVESSTQDIFQRRVKARDSSIEASTQESKFAPQRSRSRGSEVRNTTEFARNRSRSRGVSGQNQIMDTLSESVTKRGRTAGVSRQETPVETTSFSPLNYVTLVTEPTFAPLSRARSRNFHRQEEAVNSSTQKPQYIRSSASLREEIADATTISSTRGRSRASLIPEEVTTTATDPVRSENASIRRKVVSRRLKRPNTDLDTQQSSSYYDDTDDDLENKYIVGESLKKTSNRGNLTAGVIFATVPTVENEERSAINKTSSKKPKTAVRVFRGRKKAEESLVENVPDDYKKKIRKIVQRRRRPVAVVPNSLDQLPLRVPFDEPRFVEVPPRRAEAEVTFAEVMEPKRVEVVVTSTTPAPSTAAPRRGNQDYLSNLRSRSRTTTTSTTTTERPARRPGVSPDRRRKFRPERTSSTTSKPDSIFDGTSTSQRSSGAVRRRRPVSRKITTTSTTELPPSEAEAVEGRQLDSGLPISGAGDELPDLADPAAVAIYNLATLFPAPVRESATLPPPDAHANPLPRPFSLPSGSSFQETTTTQRQTVTPAFRETSPAFRATTVAFREVSPAFTETSPALRNHRLTPGRTFATSYTDFREMTPVIPTTTRVALEAEDTPSIRNEVVIAPRRHQTTTTETSPSPPPPARAPSQRRLKPFSKVPKQPSVQVLSKPLAPQQEDEYYDDADSVSLADVPVSALKVKVHSDGYIECLDQGNFPHPFSCKKFISCAKMENTDLLGWEYTCPKHLSFDPVGGICNWSAGLGCQH